MVLSVRKTIETPLLPFVARWSIVQVSQVHVVEEVFEIPQLLLVEKLVLIPEVLTVQFSQTCESLGNSWTRLLTCPLVCRRVDGCDSAGNCGGSDMVVDVQVSQAPVVEDTVVIPQFQLVEKFVVIPEVLTVEFTHTLGVWGLHVMCSSRPGR